MRLTRRTFVINAAGAAGARYLAAQSTPRQDWQAQAAAILARIKPPKFPNRDFEITKFGVSDPIAKAIDACSAAGGGRVVIPRGEHLTGAIRLKSNVNLYVSEGATLKFSRDPKDYPTVYTRFEGVECMNYSPLIYAFEQSNIAITGTGTLDGQADHGTLVAVERQERRIAMRCSRWAPKERRWPSAYSAWAARCGRISFSRTDRKTC